MLTQDEINYLQTIPAEKKATVLPFNPKAKETGEAIVAKINEVLPDLEVLFMGATSLGIAGQNDIDIYALASPVNFQRYLPSFEKIFGKATATHETYIEWKFLENNFDVELYLTDPESPSMQRQIKVFETLKSNPQFLKEYEGLKLSFNGKSHREYQKAKYDFYHKVT